MNKLIQLKNLGDYIIHLINTLENKIIKRTSKIGIIDLFYCLFIKIGQNISFDCAVNELNYNDICSATKSAFIKKCSLIDYKDVQFINSLLTDHFNTFIKEHKKYNLIGIDGTLLYLPFKFDNFMMCNNGKCRIVLCSALYNVETKTSINYIIHKNKNERDALMEQFKYIKKNDIVIHDRGYYSEDILNAYICSGFNAIFRLPKNNNFVKMIKKENVNDLIINYTLNKKPIRLRLLYYKINTGTGDQNYYLLTTVIDRFDIDFFKDAYHKRWNIETHFRDLKKNYSISDIKSKTLNGIHLEVAINNTISIISSYVEFIASTDNNLLTNANYKINTTTCKNLVTRNLIRLLLYKSPKSNKYMDKLLKLISKSVVMIKKNRTYKRIRKKPRGKWGINGTTSNGPNNNNQIYHRKKKVKKPDKT